jgi:hypothetical protein
MGSTPPWGAWLQNFITSAVVPMEGMSWVRLLPGAPFYLNPLIPADICQPTLKESPPIPFGRTAPAG